MTEPPRGQRNEQQSLIKAAFTVWVLPESSCSCVRVCMCVCVCYLQSLQRALHLTSYTRVGPFEWCVTCQLAQAATLYTLLHSSHGSTVPGPLASPLYVAPVQIWDVWVSPERGWGKNVKTRVCLVSILKGESPNIKGKLGTSRITPRSSSLNSFSLFSFLLHLTDKFLIF